MVKLTVKTLIEIDRDVWSLTKAFATARGYTVRTALELLLAEILVAKGYKIPTITQAVSKTLGDQKCR